MRTFPWPALLLAVAPLRAQSHPLDALSAAEIRQAVSVLRASGHLTDQSRFGTITVQQPEKQAGVARTARVLGFDWSRNQGFVATVDLRANRVESWTVVDSEPPIRLLTIRRAEEIAHADPRWIEAMRLRKIDTARVSVLVALGERQKLPRRGANRVVGTFTWLRDGIPDALTVKGVSMDIDLTAGRIVSFTDARVPMNEPDAAAARAIASPREPLHPLTAQQPSGPSFRIDGTRITWDRWTLRVGVDPRRGLEVHDVAFTDGGRQRPVLYSGSVSEIVAPYGDTDFGTWYPRDEGDYGMGIYSMSSAVTLDDVPATASFLSSTMHDHLGRPIEVPRAIAVYERDGGLLWRHANQSRRARQLVISGHSTIDNYDYQFNWIFSQDGAIEGEVILSGIMNTARTSLTRDTMHADGQAMYGHLVAPGVRAPNHQHFFSYRLDLDVDGPVNTLYEVNTAAPARASENPKGELFAMREHAVGTERAARADVSFASARMWRIANPRATNALGQRTSYTLVPGAVAPAFPLATSAPMRQSGFIAHQLWATPFAPDELYAAGEFQNLGRDGDGLPKWTSADRSLANADIVLWYTLGITHIPRPEDWPFMPAHRGSFRLVPTSFFDRSPVLDVPAQKR